MEQRKVFDDDNPELPPPGAVDMEVKTAPLRPQWNIISLLTPVFISNLLATGIVLHIVVSHFGIFNQNTWYILVCIVLLLIINRQAKV